MAEEWRKLAFYDEVATTFLGLSDAPNSYEVADADKYVKVNAAHTALEFGLVAGAASGLATLDAASKCAQDPKAHKTSHENAGADEISVAGLSGELADDQPAKAHKASHQSTGADELDLTGMKADSLAEKTADTGVTVDTCLIKDGKAADSNLLEGDNKATIQDHTPKAHKASHQTLGGDEISIADLAGKSTELATHEAVKAANAILGHVIVEDASLIDVDGDGKLTLGAHAATHQDAGADEITLDSLGEPVAAVKLAGKQATDLVVHSVANAAARPTPVVAKVCHQQDDDHLYLCTAI